MDIERCLRQSTLNFMAIRAAWVGEKDHKAFVEEMRRQEAILNDEQ